MRGILEVPVCYFCRCQRSREGDGRIHLESFCEPQLILQRSGGRSVRFLKPCLSQAPFSVIPTSNTQNLFYWLVGSVETCQGRNIELNVQIEARQDLASIVVFLVHAVEKLCLESLSLEGGSTAKHKRARNGPGTFGASPPFRQSGTRVSRALIAEDCRRVVPPQLRSAEVQRCVETTPLRAFEPCGLSFGVAEVRVRRTRLGRELLRA